MPAFESAQDTDHAQLVLENTTRKRAWNGLLSTLLVAVLAWTASQAHAQPGYWLWAAPVLLGWLLLVATRRLLPLSSLLRTSLAFYGSFLLLGGTVIDSGPTALSLPGSAPVFELSTTTVLLVRAFFFGLVCAIAIREILLRKSPLLPGKWLHFLTGSVVLAAYHACESIAFGANLLLERANPELAVAAPIAPLLVCAGVTFGLAAFHRAHDRQVAFLWMQFTKDIQWGYKAAA